jgi:hypothetical protein
MASVSAEHLAGMPLSVLAALWCALLAAQRPRGFVTRAVENPEHVPCYLWTGRFESKGGHPLFAFGVDVVREWHTAEGVLQSVLQLGTPLSKMTPRHPSSLNVFHNAPMREIHLRLPG